MPIYDEAPTSGAMYPRAGLQNVSANDPFHGSLLIPRAWLGLQRPRVPMPNGIRANTPTMTTPAPPASAGTTPFHADVARRQSVAEVIYTVSPLNNVSAAARAAAEDGRHPDGKRPLLPPGFSQRVTATRQAVAAVEPLGLRKAQAAWAAGVARWRSARPSGRRDRVQRQ